MNNRVLIAEHYPKKGDVLSNFTADYTGTGYCHTSMILYYSNKRLFHCEENAFHNPPSYAECFGDLKSFKSKNENCRLFLIDKTFSENEMSNMLNYWHNVYNYGFIKLVSMLITVKLNPFYKWYFKKTGKEFKPFLGNIIKSEKVCSGRVEECLNISGNYDSFPEMDDDIIYPGLWAYKYPQYKGD